MLTLWIALIAFLLYYLGQMAWGIRAFPRIVEAIRQGRLRRTRFYGALMIGQWLPAAGILLLIAFGRFSLGDVGLAWFRPAQTGWLVIVASALAGLYFCYLALSLWSLRRNAKSGGGTSQKMPERLLPMFPVTAQEKRSWACTALTVGFAEELLFRGFLLYALGALFPALPVTAVLLISTALFGLGHLYQGIGEAVKPLLLGFLFGVFAIAFGTILPCILLHAMQDLCAVYLAGKDGTMEQKN